MGRKALQWPEPMRCGPRTLYPISFGVPREDVVACLPRKSEAFASLVPGRQETYVFPTSSFGEMEYKRMYREARYAMSPRKGGWETMRIYEILASGCVPYVPNITALPKGALPFLRKGLILRAMTLPGIDAQNLRLDPGKFDAAAYEALAAELLRHTQRRLSTEAIASYVLRVMGKPRAKNVLFVANCGHGDYQCHLSLHGLRRLLGAGLVDVPMLPYMYKQRPGPMEEVERKYPCPQSLCALVSGNSPEAVLHTFGSPAPVYGGGFSYAFRLEELRVNRSRATVFARLQRREFDLVVFGNPSVEGGYQARDTPLVMALWAAAVQHYGPEEIAIIDGRDPPAEGGLYDNVMALAARARYFLREIPDDC